MHKCMRMYELGKSAFAASLELMETQLNQKHTNDLKQRIWMSNVQTLILLSASVLLAALDAGRDNFFGRLPNCK